jgi:hypothetical protein
MGGFAESLGTCSAYLVKLWEVFEVSRYAQKLCYQAVKSNVDFVVLVQVVKIGVSRSMVGQTLVKNIRWLMALQGG